MKFDWLEDWETKGLITKEAKSRIYGDCDHLVKSSSASRLAKIITEAVEAGMRRSSKAPATIREYAEAKGPEAIMSTLGMGMMGGAYFGGKAILSGKEHHDARNKIIANKAELANTPDFAQDKEKFNARFDEVTKIAPHVAMNKDLVAKVIKPRLQSGLSSNDAQNLALIQTQYTTDLGDQMKFVPKTASISPEKMAEITSDVIEITKYAGVMSSLSEKLTKMFRTPAGMYVGAVGASTLVPYMIGLGGGAVNVYKNKQKREEMNDQLKKSFEQAIKMSDPEKEPLYENKAKARQAFQALTHFAPQVALQPQAARAFMSKLVSYDQGIQSSDLKDLTQIELNISKAKTNGPFVSGFQAAADMIGLKGVTQKGLEAGSGAVRKELEERTTHELRKTRPDAMLAEVGTAKIT